MKKRLLISFLVFIILVIVTNCNNKKEDNKQSIKKITPEEIAELSKKATVKIYGYVRDSDLISDDIEEWWGSGVIIDKAKDKYYIITNLHVIGFYNFFKLDNSGNPEINKYELVVVFPDKTKLIPQSISISSEYKDFAILTIKSNKKYPIIPLKNKLPKMGNKVYAMGHPLGNDYTFTSGIVSAIKKTKLYNQIIQTDTAINSGNSGGGMFDEYGNLIGINTWGFDKSLSEGLNFAISTREVLEALNNKKFINMPMQPKQLSRFISRINERDKK